MLYQLSWSKKINKKVKSLLSAEWHLVSVFVLAQICFLWLQCSTHSSDGSTLDKPFNTDRDFPPIQPNKDTFHPTFFLTELYTDACHQKAGLLQYLLLSEKILKVRRCKPSTALPDPPVKILPPPNFDASNRIQLQLTPLLKRPTYCPPSQQVLSHSDLDFVWSTQLVSKAPTIICPSLLQAVPKSTPQPAHFFIAVS